MTIVILHLEAAIQGGQFPKAQLSPMFMATNNTICTKFVCILSE